MTHPNPTLGELLRLQVVLSELRGRTMDPRLAYAIALNSTRVDPEKAAFDAFLAAGPWNEIMKPFEEERRALMEKHADRAPDGSAKIAPGPNGMDQMVFRDKAMFDLAFSELYGRWHSRLLEAGIARDEAIAEFTARAADVSLRLVPEELLLTISGPITPAQMGALIPMTVPALERADA